MKLKNHTLALFFAVTATAFSIVPGAQAAGAPVIDGSIPAQITGTVTAVNVAARTVQVRDAQGVVTPLQVGAEIQGLDKLKPGAKVTGTIQRPITLTVVLAGATPAPVNGHAPFVVKVDSADTRTGIVKVSDVEGGQLAIQARDPLRLNGLKAGTQAVVGLPDARSLEAQPLY